MDHFFRTAPQNPYVFAVLVVFAVVSAWQPLAKIFTALRNFYRDVVQQGLRRAFARLTEYTDRKSDRIVADPAAGSLLLLIDLRSSMHFALNAVILFGIGAAFWALPVGIESQVEQLFRKLLGAFAMLIASLSAIIWAIDGVLQTEVNSKVRKKLRAIQNHHADG